MLVWREFDSIFTFLCMQVSIMMFWIELDLIFAFFYMQVITIVLDFISTFFCMQVINIVFFISARPKKIDLFSSLNNNFSKHRYSRHISQHNLVQASKLSLKYAHWSRQINTGRIFQTFQIMQDRWRTSEKLSRSCSPCPRHHPLHCSSGVEVSALPVL